MARPSEVRLLGHRLRTEPGVFHPLYFSSSRILAAHVAARAPAGLTLLDMGTGSGAIAVAAAAEGATVTACDINPRAVALARTNAALNGLSIEVLESDLFAALAGRRFDLITFNIPFYEGAPATHYDAAFLAGPGLDTVLRFARASREHLTDDGRVLIVFSEDCDHVRTLRAFTDVGFAVEYERTTQSACELFYVTCFRPARAAPGT
jgi:release factor glutamine methyltransferase